MRDQYGTVLKIGKNIDILNKGKNYFIAKGIKISSYYFNTDCTSRRVINDETDMRKCEICGNELLRHEVGVIADKIVVRPKRSLVFIEDDGTQHSCCYKQSECLRTAKVDVDSSPVLDHTPNYDEFLSIFKSDSIMGKEGSRRLARLHYEQHVRPFLSFWIDRDISKLNLLQFNKDLNDLSFLHSLYYECGLDPILNRILCLVGVRNNNDR